MINKNHSSVSSSPVIDFIELSKDGKIKFSLVAFVQLVIEIELSSCSFAKEKDWVYI